MSKGNDVSKGNEPRVDVDVNVEQPDEREVDSTFPGVSVGDDGHERMDMPNQQVVRPAEPDPVDPPPTEPDPPADEPEPTEPAEPADSDDDGADDHERR